MSKTKQKKASKRPAVTQPKTTATLDVRFENDELIVSGELAEEIVGLANDLKREPAEIVLETLDGFMCSDKPRKPVRIELPVDLLKWANKHADEQNCTLSDLLRGILEIHQFTENKLWEATMSEK